MPQSCHLRMNSFLDRSLLMEYSAVFPMAFGFIKRIISGRDERLLCIDAGEGKRGEADADGELSAPSPPPCRTERLSGNGLTDSIGHFKRLFFFHPLREDNCKLVSAVTGGEIVTSKEFPEDGADLLQYPISFEMAGIVIDLLKIIDIHHHAKNLASLPFCTPDFPLKKLLQILAVIESRQGVDNREPLQLSDALFELILGCFDPQQNLRPKEEIFNSVGPGDVIPRAAVEYFPFLGGRQERPDEKDRNFTRRFLLGERKKKGEIILRKVGGSGLVIDNQIDLFSGEDTKPLSEGFGLINPIGRRSLLQSLFHLPPLRLLLFYQKQALPHSCLLALIIFLTAYNT